MSAWELPVSVEIEGRQCAIRSDFRAVLDALAAFSDRSMTQQERMASFLQIMYPEWQTLADGAAAFQAAMQFVNLGEPMPEHQPPKPQLVEWSRDAELIAPAVDKVLGYSSRRCAYLHWWEFIGAYSNIGDGLFAQVVGIRSKRARGKKLEKHEQEFLREHADLIGAVVQTTPEEEEFFRQLGV